MSCPSLYLGPNRYTSPLPGEYGNPAIALTSYVLTVNVQVYASVTVNNHGTDDSPSSLLELYWSDPSTGFQALPARQIGSASNVVPGAAAYPGGQDDGAWSNNFSWTPDNTVLGTNSGHVCLLARVSNNVAPGGACSQQTYDSSSPATDPLSAIHNVQIVTSTGGGGGGGKKRMAFAFAATNTLRNLDDTKIEVHPLDPAHDREKLERLVGQPAVDNILAKRCVKFAMPQDVQLVEGRERVIVDPSSRNVQRGAIARIGTLGPIDPRTVSRLTGQGKKPLPIKAPGDLKLVFGESRQMILSVESTGSESEAYGVEVRHLGADGRNIGGLVFVFVSPHKYF